jgi:hypothetical protein
LPTLRRAISSRASHVPNRPHFDTIELKGAATPCQRHVL